MSTQREELPVTAANADSAARDLYTRLLEAWNARNADDYAALFATDATVIGFDGGQASGTQIGEHVRGVFDDHMTATYVAKVHEVRSLGPDAVLVRANAGMVPPGRHELNPMANVVQTVVAERRGDDWWIVLFQNTPAQYHGRPDLAEQHTAELEPLVSSGTVLA